MLPPDFRKQKWALALWILGIGTGVALLWSAWESLVCGKGYPESYVLGPPQGRFSDFTDETFVSRLPNPYMDPTSFYPPTSYIFFRFLSFSDSASLVLMYDFCLVAMIALLARVFTPIARGTWMRYGLAFFFLSLCYPVIFCLDRGNIEILVAALLGGAIYFYSRHRYFQGTVCLLPAICLKIYPVLFLIFLLRRRRVGLALWCVMAAASVTLASCFAYQVNAESIWHSYQQNLDYYRHCDLLTNNFIEGSSSPWNMYKIVVIGLQTLGLMKPVEFNFDGTFITDSFLIFTLVFGAWTAFCVLYAWLYEQHSARSALLLLLLLSIAAPNGADYRLIYASMALVLIIFLPQRRRGDLTALVLVALAVIPKKEVMLTFVGVTETDFADVPIQALLNPILILVAMAVLLYHARHPINWSALKRNLHPLRWRWI